MWEGDLILRSDLLSDDQFINIVELIPILIFLIDISKQRLEFRTARNGHVQSLRGVKTLLVEQMEVVLVAEVAEQLPGQSVQIAHDVQGQVPLPVTGAVDLIRELQRVVVVEPIVNSVILLLVQLHLNRFQRFHLKQLNYHLPVKYCPRSLKQAPRRRTAEIAFV